MVPTSQSAITQTPSQKVTEMKVNKDGDYVEPCMLVPVSDLIHLIEERNAWAGAQINGESAVEWRADYADLLKRATHKLAHVNKRTIQQ